MSEVTITATMVSALRQRTGAGMMDCKKALVAANGDMENAAHEIAKSGNRKAEKTAGRQASEGVIYILPARTNTANGMKNTVPAGIAMVEINCETDFVAKDPSFLEFARKVAQVVLSTTEEDLDFIKNRAPFEMGPTLEELRKTLIGQIGENIQIRRAIYAEVISGCVSYYLHSNQRIGVVVCLHGGDVDLAKEVAMHIAALAPEYFSSAEVPAERLAKETDILTAQSDHAGKPAAIVEKIIQGRLDKYLNEICLSGQPFVKNPEITVGQLLKEKGARMLYFGRMEVGEGLEKKTDANFADEVAGMIGGQ